MQRESDYFRKFIQESKVSGSYAMYVCLKSKNKGHVWRFQNSKQTRQTTDWHKLIELYTQKLTASSETSTSNNAMSYTNVVGVGDLLRQWLLVKAQLQMLEMTTMDTLLTSHLSQLNSFSRYLSFDEIPNTNCGWTSTLLDWLLLRLKMDDVLK